MGLIGGGWGWAGVAGCMAFCVLVGIAVHYLVERSAADVLAGKARWGWNWPRRIRPVRAALAG